MPTATLPTPWSDVEIYTEVSYDRLEAIETGQPLQPNLRLMYPPRFNPDEHENQFTYCGPWLTAARSERTWVPPLTLPQLTDVDRAGLMGDHRYRGRCAGIVAAAVRVPGYFIVGQAPASSLSCGRSANVLATGMMDRWPRHGRQNSESPGRCSSAHSLPENILCN
jgi:hypothetical protein